MNSAIKDGNGLKFKKNYKAVPDLVRLYLDKASEMLSDIRMSNEDKENKIILGSMITEEAFNKVKDMPIGLCVFSPPYANCFDYCEVYMTNGEMYSIALKEPPYPILTNPFTYSMGIDAILSSESVSHNNPISKIVLNASLNNAQKNIMQGGNMGIKFNFNSKR